VTAYATRRDLYRYGLPRGGLTMPGRIVDQASAGSDIITLDGHGFETDDAVLVRAVDGGSVASPLAEGVTYYVIRVTDATFKLAATAGGSAIDLTSAGESMLVAAALAVDEVLEFYSRFVDAFLPSHAVPLLAPYDITVVALVAELAAKKLLMLSGQTSIALDAAEIAAKAQLERWAKGIPLRSVAATQAATNLAVVSTLSSTSNPRGWGSGSLP
jgi:hypothetical protein